MRTYQHKYLDDGTLNPKYKPDSRTGDRHKSKGDRHATKGDRHQAKGDRHLSKFEAGRFIAIDGEGDNVPDNTPQNYILLASSETEPLVNLAGLSTRQCFDYLGRLATTYPADKAIFVGYFITYDVQQWLRDVPREILEEVWTGRGAANLGRHAVYRDGDRRYEITWRPNKMFSLKFWHGKRQWVGTRRKDGTVAYKPKNDWEITVWDVGGFFQHRFTETLGEWFKKERGTDEQGNMLIRFPDGWVMNLTDMELMKEARGSFTAEQMKQVGRYCKDECKALVCLMNRLREYLIQADIPVSRWDGAGACATALMHKHSTNRAHEGEMMNNFIRDAQLRGYFGARIEMLQWGLYLGPSYDYDVRSAYPSAMVELPTLTDGKWVLDKTGGPRQQYSLSHVRWSFEEAPFYPFPFRVDQTIYFPSHGEGWYWRPEIDSYLAQPLKGEFEIIETLNFYPKIEAKPFAFLHEVYQQRLEWKKQGIGGQMALKLAINALYGKMAQTIGWSLGTDGDVIFPPSYNMGWAGYVTSHCRARLWLLGRIHPENVVAFQTDGIFMTAPIEGLDTESEVLGGYELATCDGIMSIQAGVFFLFDKDNETPDLIVDGQGYASEAKYRGYDQGCITPEIVLTGWRAKQFTIPVSSRRFITIGSALTGDRFWGLWRSWYRVDRILSLLPQGKRSAPIMDVQPKPYHDAHLGLCPTYACDPLPFYLDDNLGVIETRPMSDLFDLRMGDTIWKDGKEEGVDSNVVEMEIIATEDS